MNAAVLALLLLHGDSVSSSRIEIDGCEARVIFTFSMEDLAELARLDTDRSGIVEPEEWRRVMPALLSYLGERFQIDGCRSEGDPGFLPPATPLKERRTPVTIRMRYLSPSPIDRLRVRCGLFHEHEGNPRHVAELPGGRTAVFDRFRTASDVPIERGGFPFYWIAAALIAAVSYGFAGFSYQKTPRLSISSQASTSRSPSPSRS